MSEKKSLLEYGTEPAFPAMTLPDVEGFKDHTEAKAGQYIQDKARQIKKDYEELVQLATDTELVRSKAIQFEPIVGKEYYLYEEFLSLIGPHEWNRDDYVGTFVLTADGTWVRQ